VEGEEQPEQQHDEGDDQDRGRLDRDTGDEARELLREQNAGEPAEDQQPPDKGDFRPVAVRIFRTATPCALDG
jgi:hypothetical protein